MRFSSFLKKEITTYRHTITLLPSVWMVEGIRPNEFLFRVFGWRAAGDGANPQGNIRTRCGFATSAKIGRTEPTPVCRRGSPSSFSPRVPELSKERPSSALTWRPFPAAVCAAAAAPPLASPIRAASPVPGRRPCCCYLSITPFLSAPSRTCARRRRKLSPPPRSPLRPPLPPLRSPTLAAPPSYLALHSTLLPIAQDADARARSRREVPRREENRHHEAASKPAAAGRIPAQIKPQVRCDLGTRLLPFVIWLGKIIDPLFY